MMCILYIVIDNFFFGYGMMNMQFISICSTYEYVDMSRDVVNLQRAWSVTCEQMVLIMGLLTLP